MVLGMTKLRRSAAHGRLAADRDVLPVGTSVVLEAAEPVVVAAELVVVVEV